MKQMTWQKWAKIWTAFLIYGILVFAFTELAEQVMDHSTQSLDVAILQRINTLSDPGLDGFFVFITDLSGPVVVPILALLLAAWFIWKNEAYNAIYLFLILGGTFLVNTALKLYYQRVRPNLWSLLVEESSYSFPSGHAMISMALALSLIVLLFYSRLRWPAILIGTGYVLLIGFSRLYLGVHYPSDIVGGWLASMVWSAVVTGIMMRNNKFRDDTMS